MTAAHPVDARHNSTLTFTRGTNQIARIASYIYNTSDKHIVRVLSLFLIARVSVSETSRTPDTIYPRLPLSTAGPCSYGPFEIDLYFVHNSAVPTTRSDTVFPRPVRKETDR